MSPCQLTYFIQNPFFPSQVRLWTTEETFELGIGGPVFMIEVHGSFIVLLMAFFYIWNTRNACWIKVTCNIIFGILFIESQVARIQCTFVRLEFHTRIKILENSIDLYNHAYPKIHSVSIAQGIYDIDQTKHHQVCHASMFCTSFLNK